MKYTVNKLFFFKTKVFKRITETKVQLRSQTEYVPLPQKNKWFPNLALLGRASGATLVLKTGVPPQMIVFFFYW